MDTLTGGPGADLFVLGKVTRYYVGHNANDYALVTDFTPAKGDKLQLMGKATDYVLVKETAPGSDPGVSLLGLSIYVDRNQDGAYSPPNGSFTGDDLVAHLAGFTGGAKPSLDSFTNFYVPSFYELDLPPLTRIDLSQVRAPKNAGPVDLLLDFGEFDNAGSRDYAEVKEFRLGKDRLVTIEPPDHRVLTAKTKYEGVLSTAIYADTNDNGFLDLNARGGDDLLAILVGTQLKTYGIDDGLIVGFAADLGL